MLAIIWFDHWKVGVYRAWYSILFYVIVPGWLWHDPTGSTAPGNSSLCLSFKKENGFHNHQFITKNISNKRRWQKISRNNAKWVTLWIQQRQALFSFPFSLYVHWFAELSSQSEALLSQTGSSTDSTRSIGQKATDKSRLVPVVWDTLQQRHTAPSGPEP